MYPVKESMVSWEFANGTVLSEVPCSSVPTDVKDVAIF